VIARLQYATHTARVLAALYRPDERGDPSNPRLVAGDGHGAPFFILANADTPPELAQYLNQPVMRLGYRAPKRAVWVCSVRSDPHHPDLNDARWGKVARRLVAATVAPDGDRDACRWIALRTRPRQVHIVATLVREDGRLHNAHHDAFRLQRECRLIATELSHRPAPNGPPAPPLVQESPVPLTVTIAPEPSGAVVARGGDTLAQSLLAHAGFPFTSDWYGPRHRLPTSMSRQEQTAISTQAAQMLRAARYTVELHPDLDTTPAGPQQAPSLGDQLLAVTDRIRGAESGAALAGALAPLLHAEHGVLERVREALEAAGEQVTDLDDEAYQLSDRFGFASEFLTAAQGELLGTEEELRRVAVPGQEHAAVRDARSAALATSPAATKAASSRSASPAAPVTAPPAGPASTSASRPR
jgi:hypothetical protein